jgi:hypothetical protein
MKLSDIITVSKAWRSKTHTAAIKGADYVACDAKTAEEAQRKLVDAVAEHFRHGHTRRYFFSPSGKTTFALYHQFGGWCYDIIQPGRSSQSTCSMSSACTLTQAEESVKRHAADYVEEEK